MVSTADLTLPPVCNVLPDPGIRTSAEEPWRMLAYYAALALRLECLAWPSALYAHLEHFKINLVHTAASFVPADAIKSSSVL
jgi:hypothetical protein